MSGPTIAAQVAEHAPTGVGVGFAVWLGHLVRDHFRRQKPVEEAAHTTVENFVALNERLGKEIERLDVELATVRAKHGKLSRYAALLFRWALDIEAIAKAAGLNTPSMPELPVLD